MQNNGQCQDPLSVKCGCRADEGGGQGLEQAGLLFAAKTANELKQYVVTGAGSVLDEGQLDIVEEIATATKITITGNSPVADFWQLVEIEDLTTRQKTQEYLWEPLKTSVFRGIYA